MALFILLWAAIITITGIIIGTQNGNTFVDLFILTWTFRGVPLTLVLIETFALGILFTIIVAVIDEIRLKNRLWRTQGELKELKKELTALRNLPVEDVNVNKEEDDEVAVTEKKKESK